MPIFQPVEVPIYMTATFHNPLPSGEPSLSDRGSELKYSREENPTVRELERKIAQLDGFNDCLAFNSGMAAISTLLLVNYRRKIIVNLDSYPATVSLALDLRSMGFDVELRKTDELGDPIPSDSVVFTESLTNPLLRVPDLSALRDACEDSGSLLLIDNTLATPVLLKPSTTSDYSVQSATKYLSGTNDVFGGVVSGNNVSELWDWRRKLGNIIDPLRAFLITRGLFTLELRVRKHSENAMIIAKWLEDHEKVDEVIYPGLDTHKDHNIAKKLFGDLFGGIVSFRIRGDPNRFLLSLRRVIPATSFGACRSLASIPRASLASNLPSDLVERSEVDEKLVRLSVGLEDPELLIEDLQEALRSS
ncbi:MAG: PLP-dependent transferase [Candidatus Korarchaeum sp.]